MKLNLDILPVGRSEEDVELVFHRELEADPTDSFTLDGRLTVDNTSANVLLAGEVRVRGQYDCDRCLEMYELSYTAPVNILIQRSGHGDPDQESDIFEIHQHGGLVDLDEALREAAMIAWPLRTVCSDSCRGLCPICGQNLNVAECDCKPEADDPRWDALPT